jgi:hypothetical protein
MQQKNGYDAVQITSLPSLITEGFTKDNRPFSLYKFRGEIVRVKRGGSLADIGTDKQFQIWNRFDYVKELEIGEIYFIKYSQDAQNKNKDGELYPPTFTLANRDFDEPVIKFIGDRANLQLGENDEKVTVLLQPLTDEIVNRIWDNKPKPKPETESPEQKVNSKPQVLTNAEKDRKETRGSIEEQVIQKICSTDRLRQLDARVKLYIPLLTSHANSDDTWAAKIKFIGEVAREVGLNENPLDDKHVKNMVKMLRELFNEMRSSNDN